MNIPHISHRAVEEFLLQRGCAKRGRQFTKDNMELPRNYHWLPVHCDQLAAIAAMVRLPTGNLTWRLLDVTEMLTRSAHGKN